MDEQEIVVAATGDSMISRRISVNKETQQIAEIIREADVRFTNCEMLFHKCESYPMPRASGPARTMMHAEPKIVKELSWIGFNLASLCNTHTMDYGPQGMFSTMEALEDAGIVYAGAGRDLDEAREPKYLDTAKGRVALTSAGWDDTLHEPWERANKMRTGIPARPGINLLRVDTKHIVSKELFGALKKTIAETSLNPARGMGLNPPKGKFKESELNFLGHKFTAGIKPGTYRTVRKEDLEENVMCIKDARRSADWVFASLHSHSSDGRGGEYPADFICEYAKACIDAGADAFLGHGPHILRGIEVYKKKPIFYSLGNFIMQNLVVDKVTYDQYESLGLGQESRPSDFYDTRIGIIPPSEPPYSRWWLQSVVAIFRMAGSTLTEVKLHPITLGLGETHRPRIGSPKLAEGEEAKAIIENLGKISSQWGTKISYENGIGRIAL